MLVFEHIKNLQNHLSSLALQQTIGFVPTMGALHKGHLSLIERAKNEADIVVVSIFVNPTQFNRKEDLEKYPRTLSKDLELLESIACDVVFCPEPQEVYNGVVKSQNFNFGSIASEMEGKHRAGHFDGVATIVKRLFEIVKPHKAFFGEKDFQQVQIVKKMVENFNLPVEIVGCEILRESDGLAMSSRNTLLNEDQRKSSPLIFNTLTQVKQQIKNNSIENITMFVEEQFESNPDLELEYFQIAEEESLEEIKTIDPTKNLRAFIAVFAGNVRLIDNIKL